ncbi:MAG: hypothetical protein ABSB11_05390 [Sedimentisphaerales bacterium]|jgi:hypothetical protein
MKNVIICIVICILNLPALALDYNDFPPDLQKILDDRTADFDPNGGVFIAGRVTMDDGTHIGSGKDIKVNLEYSFSDSLWVYDDGWFIMGRPYKSVSNPGPAKLSVRAFGYDPITASIPVSRNDITYLEYVMHKTPDEKLSSIAGVIINDQNEPVENAMIDISFPLPYREQPSMSIYTEPNGYYLFEGLSATEYNLLIHSIPGYASISCYVTSVAGKTTISNHKIYRNLGIVIDYVYQSDGSRSFSQGELKTGSVEWTNCGHGMDFSEGKLKGYDPKMLRDLEMMQNEDKLSFFVTYVNGKNGFYDAGETDFDSITEAAEEDYTTGFKPCLTGHVYVIRTYENNYAKFIVRSISVNK